MKSLQGRETYLKNIKEREIEVEKYRSETFQNCLDFIKVTECDYFAHVTKEYNIISSDVIQLRWEKDTDKKFTGIQKVNQDLLELIESQDVWLNRPRFSNLWNILKKEIK